MIRPLHPLVYFRRNPVRVAPLVFVIMLAVMLVACVVTIVDSIQLTIYTLYGYNRYLTGLTPRNALDIPSDQIERIRKLPQLGALYPAHSYQVLIKTIFGKMPFPIFGLSPDGRRMLLERSHVRLIAGRMPREGQPEAAISDDVARNLKVPLGGVLANPNSLDDYAPVPIRLVGLLHGSVWLGITSKSEVDKTSPFSFVGYLAFAPNASPAAQRALDAAIERVVDHTQVRVWRFADLVHETESALSNLYLILNLAIGIIVFAIAFVCGLLANIYFSQRLPEIAMLAAIGYHRGFLLRRALGEVCLYCLCGWVLGGLLTVGTLWIIRAVFLAPKGLLLDIFDPTAFVFTLPLPLTIALFALATIAFRLASLDPVSIIERR